MIDAAVSFVNGIALGTSLVDEHDRIRVEHQVDVDQIADWLRLLTCDAGVVELLAVEYQHQQLVKPVTMGGFFDKHHLHEMAETAVALSEHAAGVYWSLNPLIDDLLGRAANRIKIFKHGDAASDEHVLRRRWLCIDVDPVLSVAGISATDAEKNYAREKAEQVRNFLAGQGWPAPVFADSGNGCHLLYRIDMAAEDNGLIQSVLSALAERFTDGRAKIDTTVGNPVRVCRLYGTMARKGDSLPARPHRVSRVVDVPPALSVVSIESLQQLTAAVVSQEHNSPAPPELPSPIAGALIHDRARAYLAGMPPAISGQGGHNRTFEAACRLMLGFGLSVEQSLPLLREWNERCEPPWSEAELRHKLDDADRQAGDRGYLLQDRNCRRQQFTERPAATGLIFPIAVPDFISADPAVAMPPLSIKRGRRSNSSGVRWAIHQAVIIQRTSAIVLPDTLLRAIIWGSSNWPPNWRSLLLKWLKLRNWNRGNARSCCGVCPFHGTDNSHLHLPYHVSPKSLGALEGYARNDDGIRLYDFQPDYRQLTKEMRVHLRQLRKRLMPAYFPALLFGRSPRVGMSMSQRRLLVGIVRELTRTPKSQRRRPDGAELVVGADVPDACGTVRCRLLDASQRYVMFGGNGRKRHGRGYRIIGRTCQGWLARAGYSKQTIESDCWGTVRKWLCDLTTLAESFQLVIAAHHNRRQEWRSLEEMKSMVRNDAGRQWLDQCCVRIFANEDYLGAWRRHFASRLGFAEIPGG